jgi:hypothetical protein
LDAKNKKPLNNYMAVLQSDIKFLLSGGASNTDPDAALGGIISATAVVDDTLNNLFDDVSGAEHAAGDTNYRCIYVKNDSASIAYNVKLYIDQNTPAVDDAITIGKDLAGLNATADTIADEATAPDPAVTFSSAAGYANAIDLGNIPAGEVYAFWVKRIVSAGSTAQALDDAILKVSVDTA